MAAETVRVHGLRELNRALSKVEKDLAKEVRQAFREAAEPVRVEAALLFAPVSARSAAGYRVVVRQRGVAVEQKYGRTTGDHPEFGAMQMQTALIPALQRNEDKVFDGTERVIGRLINREDLDG